MYEINTFYSVSESVAYCMQIENDNQENHFFISLTHDMIYYPFNVTLNYLMEYIYKCTQCIR